VPNPNSAFAENENWTAKYLENANQIKKALGQIADIVDEPHSELVDYDKLNSGPVNPEHQQ